MAGRNLAGRRGLAGATAPVAGELPARHEGDNGAPVPVPAQVEALGRANRRAVESLPSDFGNKLGNTTATNPDLSLADFLAGRPVPEADLVQRGWRVPRYVGEAVRLASMRERVPEQGIVLRALLESEALRPYLVLAYNRATEEGR